jgi:hypothetical protein
MSQNNTAIVYTGLDVAKLSLQLHFNGRFHNLANDAKGHAKLLKLLRAQPGVQIICEATGDYEQPVVLALQAADVSVSGVEAGRGELLRPRSRPATGACSPLKPLRMSQASTATNTFRLPEKLNVAVPTHGAAPQSSSLDWPASSPD